MQELTEFLTWVAQNRAELTTVLLTLCGACTALNRIIPADKGPKWLHGIIDWASAMAKPGTDGHFGTPMLVPFVTRSQEKPCDSN